MQTEDRKAAARLRRNLAAAMFTVFAVGMAGQSARAAIRNVPAQYPTIQAAINAAGPGDTISVADGTYTGAGNRDIEFIGSDLTVTSATGNRDRCIIDCQQLGRGFSLHSGETAASQIIGFTIKNGLANGYGGGVYAYNNSTVTVKNCAFVNNTAKTVSSGFGGYGYGGAIYNGTATNGTPIVYTAINCLFDGNAATGSYGSGGGTYGINAMNCTFINNTAAQGGGGMYGGIATNCSFGTTALNGNTAGSSGGGMYSTSYTTDGNAIGCLFIGNKATSGSGGGMYYGAAINCNFVGNTAGNSGGGLYGYYGGFGGGNGSATRCTFSGNMAPTGGGMYNGGASHCDFRNNTATTGSGGGYVGTGYYSYYNQNTLDNCLFYNNTAKTNGGGVVNAPLNFCTVVNNKALGSYGGGIYNSTSNDVRNCIIWGNTSVTTGPNVYNSSGATTVKYTDVYPGYNGAGNKTADPMFANLSANDLHLTAGSPCINTGTTTDLPSGFAAPARDLDDGTRVYGGQPDMGAYEYGSTPLSLQSIYLPPAPVVGGQTVNGVITLATPAPAGGASVFLSSSDTTVATVPVSVTVLAGATTAAFTVTTFPVTASQTPIITATSSGVLRTASLAVIPPPPPLIGLSLFPTSVVGGKQNSTGTVTLASPAPTGGVTISISNNDATATTVPTTVLVSAGATTANFGVTSLPVLSTKVVAIVAAFNGVTMTAYLTVNPSPVTLVSLTLSPPSVIGGSQNSTGTVTLADPAPAGGATILLTSGDTTAATVPASVTVSAGAKTAVFTVTSLSVNALKKPVITASANGVSLPATLTVMPLMTLLWQNGGDVRYWKMNKTTFTGITGYVNKGGDPNWKVVGYADVTKDGQPDVILQNSATGQVYYWQMDGTTIVGGDYLEPTVGSRWRLAAVTDVTGDGQPDLIWQDNVTGDIFYWKMNGVKSVGGGLLSTGGGTAWRLEAVADVTGDGQPDLIWLYTTTGDIFYWKMNGLMSMGGGLLAKSGGATWRFAFVTDVTGDGQSDLLWQNNTNGDVYYWQMNGLIQTGGGYLEQGQGALGRIVGMH